MNKSKYYQSHETIRSFGDTFISKRLSPRTSITIEMKIAQSILKESLEKLTQLIYIDENDGCIVAKLHYHNGFVIDLKEVYRGRKLIEALDTCSDRLEGFGETESQYSEEDDRIPSLDEIVMYIIFSVPFQNILR